MGDVGEFVVDMAGRQRVFRNVVHDEGAEWLWRRAFEGAGTITSWMIGLTALDLPNDHARRYDAWATGAHTEVGLKPATTYADIASDKSSQGAAWGDRHLELMTETGEQTVTFTHGAGVSGYMLSSWAAFSNQIPWTPSSVGNCGGWMSDGHTIPNKTGGIDAPAAGSWISHDYPWAVPILWPGEWLKADSGNGRCIDDVGGDDEWRIDALVSGGHAGRRAYITDLSICARKGPYTVLRNDGDGLIFAGNLPVAMTDGKTYYVAVRDIDDVVEAIEANPWLGASVPFSAIYLAASDGTNKKLIASSLLAQDWVLAPQATMRIRYRGVVRAWNSRVDE